MLSAGIHATKHLPLLHRNSADYGTGGIGRHLAS
jgi:hypothetical protein